MSEISTMLGNPSAQILPGYTLSEFGMYEIGLTENYFADQHIAESVVASSSAADAYLAHAPPPPVLPNGQAGPQSPHVLEQIEITRKTIIGLAANDKKEGEFLYWTRPWRAKAQEKSSFPFLLWTCLRIKHPELTIIAASALITPQNEWPLRRAVLEKLGFKFDFSTEKKAKAPTSQTDQKPTGETSSSSSEKNAA